MTPIIWNSRSGVCIFIIISCLSLRLISGAILPNSLEQAILKRRLGSCSTYTDWSNWNADTSCSFSNGVCNGETSSSMEYQFENYNQFEGVQYCSNSVENGFIDFKSLETEELILKPQNGASESNHPLWYWLVFIEDSANVTLEITRNPNNYEHIYINTYSMIRNVRDYTSKDLSNCSSDITRVDLGNVWYIRVLTQTLGGLSNFSI